MTGRSISAEYSSTYNSVISPLAPESPLASKPDGQNLHPQAPAKSQRGSFYVRHGCCSSIITCYMDNRMCDANMKANVHEARIRHLITLTVSFFSPKRRAIRMTILNRLCIATPQ